jgi:threonyl-tRNA synthetase
MPPKRTINIESARIGAGGKFEGKFTPTKNPAYIAGRRQVWDRLLASFQAKQAEKEKKEAKPIEITLPDGAKKQGTSFKTTPMEIATGISKSLAGQVVIAKVTYSEAWSDSLKGDVMPASLSDDEDEEEAEAESNPGVTWDLNRPLEGSCKLELLKWDSPQGTEAFWHSSAHMLGAALEQLYGGHLCVGPPLESGFYYDIFVGDKKLNESDFNDIQTAVTALANKKEPFERLVLTKEEALEMFADNPFKVQLISTKIPDGALTSAYRCADLIDLCRGPHVPTTDRIKSFMCTKNSSAYWLGKADYDSLQRIYGISFPDDKRMKEYKKMLEEAAERDHRNVGNKQELFFFHSSVSPGSCFWQPMGARIYNSLISFVRREYLIRGFQEVISPNIYSEELFKRSGHYQNYKDCMYGFDVEGQEWFLKPMNCPGHCMIFDHRVRSYKELPYRMASFGVLHRNELSGTLSGLTRVRRFQQDDAHIFCRPEQIKAEVKGALDFLYYIYKVFGFEFSIALSTRPKKAIGEKAVWDRAEAALKEALNESGVDWTLNPGDGAFYGPKIDIRLLDAMRRRHQCGTIQLDFQLPIRFNLQYRAEGTPEEDEAADGGEDKKKSAEEKKEDKKKASEEKKKVEKAEEEKRKAEEAESGADPKKPGEYVWKEQKVKPGFERPVIIHRAILGSVERMVAILTEHYGGKWPFWLSPRQVMIVPVASTFNDYAKYVCDTLTNFGFHAEADYSSNTLNKKIRNGQIAQWNYSAIVGEKEEAALGVQLRSRDEKADIGAFSLSEFIDKLKGESEPSSQKFNEFTAYKGRLPEGTAQAAAPASSASAPKAAAKSGAAGGAAPKAKAAAGSGSKGAAGGDEAFLQDHPYLGGFAPSKKDRELFASLAELPKTANLARWYEHISSFTPNEKESWS